MRFPRGLSHLLPLGGGGEADVFQAWQNPPGRSVLIKCSRDAEGASRLRHEAQLLSELSDCPVPALLAFRDHSRRAVLVQEWIRGVSFRRLVAAGLTPPEKRGIFLGLCRAVARLHEAQLVHGDLSDANLIAQARGEVVVIDFGLAFRPGRGESSGGLGTWEIAAPELLRDGTASPASDVFALGVIALSLWNPGGDLRRSRAVWSEAALSGKLAELGAEVHPALGAALAPDPRCRPERADLLLKALLEDESWHHPAWPAAAIEAAEAAEADRRLEREIGACVRRGDWEMAWRWQKERVEAVEDPEPLLPSLSEYARKRAAGAVKRRHFRLAAGLLLLLVVSGALWFGHRQMVAARTFLRGSEAHPGAEEEYDTLLYPSGSAALNRHLLPFSIGPQPPSAQLWVDGLPQELPMDDTLWMESGEHHVELRDASGNLLHDTLVHLRVHHPHRPKVEPRRPSVRDSSGKSFPAFPTGAFDGGSGDVG